jgi:TPR repeat protein
MIRRILYTAAAVAATLYAVQPVYAQSAAARECIRVDGLREVEGSTYEARDQARKAWLVACRDAVATDGGDRLKRILARADGALGMHAEELPLLRELAERGDGSAAYTIYDIYKSYYRSDVTKPQMVKREEAERGLRRSAELGYPYGVVILMVLLERGSTVKRNIGEAIQWAERLVANPDKESGGIVDAQIRLGRLLTLSDDPEQKARGIALLESRLEYRDDAKAYLAQAIRARDAERARKLLESGLRGYPGAAIPPLADMLIKGEGGRPDPKRAVSLLMGRTAQDVPGVRGAHGLLLIDGKLVPQDLKKGTDLLRTWASWNQDARIRLMSVLAENPELAVIYPEGMLYDATEAADLDEPGALDALIALKLSPNKQFADKPGGCALAKRAGRQRSECGAN